TGSTACLGRLADTPDDGHYTPAVPSSGPPPCFASDSRSITFALLGANIPVQDGRIAAVYSASPASGLMTGLIRGFVSQTDAQNTNFVIPVGQITVPVAMNTLLPGDAANCKTTGADAGPGQAQPHSDIQKGPETVPVANRVDGWYVYLEFTAVKETYTSQ